MTSNTTGTIGDLAPTLSSSSIYQTGFEPYRAFNGAPNEGGGYVPVNPSFTSSSGSFIGSEWMNVDFGVGHAPSLHGMRLYNGTDTLYVTGFEIQASDDGTTWTTQTGPYTPTTNNPLVEVTW